MVALQLLIAVVVGGGILFSVFSGDFGADVVLAIVACLS